MIRTATDADAPLLARIEASAGGPLHAPWSEDALRDTLAAPATEAWLAGEVAHLVTQRAVDTADIVTVAVHLDARGRGHAKALLAHAEGVWKGSGVAEVFLEVRSDNVPARGLYVRCGFEEVGLRRRYYADGTDAVVMRRVIART